MAGSRGEIDLRVRQCDWFKFDHQQEEEEEEEEEAIVADCEDRPHQFEKFLESFHGPLDQVLITPRDRRRDSLVKINLPDALAIGSLIVLCQLS